MCDLVVPGKIPLYPLRELWGTMYLAFAWMCQARERMTMTLYDRGTYGAT